MPDLIKIDVEGGEMEVLRGGEKLFGMKRPLIIAEIDTRQAGRMSSVGSRAMRTPHRKWFSAILFLLACLHGQKNSIRDPGRSQEAWKDSNSRVWT